MSGLLSSFAISVAANIVTSLFSKNNTEKEIRTAFQDAIEKWCPNEDIRRFREREISKLLEDYMANPNMDPSNLPADMKEFLSVFEKCVAEHPAAFNYLSAIKEKGYYDVVMTSIQGVHQKLDVIQEKLDAANPIHEELHSEAVAEINTVLAEEVEDAVNTLLYGIIAAFDDEDVFAYTEVHENGDIEVVIDDDSMLVEEDGDFYRPKFHDIDYDWDKENRPDWTTINPDTDFWEMFSESYIAAFQLMRINFNDGMDEIQSYLDKKSINDQLSTDEKRQLNFIIQNMRAVELVFDKKHDIFLKVEKARFCNLEVKCVREFEQNGLQLGHFEIYYATESYREKMTETIAPMEMQDNLLDVYMINPDYYFKVTGYVGELFHSVRAWWELSGIKQDEMEGEE